jgi:FMN-dependent NADH-azoreductase
MKLLQINASVLGDNSVSRRLAGDITASWLAVHPETTVEQLDLVQDPLPHLGPDALALRMGLDDAVLSDAQRRENAITERVLAQFLAADVVVVGAPMYNFSIPSQLKAWIDRLAQPGRTFRYTAKGPEGLAGGKTVFVASSRAGVYSGSVAMAAMEHQESYLRAVFGFFGITDVRIVRAEGLALGEAARAQALDAAARDIRRHVGAGRVEQEALAA